MEQFSAGPINKAVPSFRKRLREHVKACGDILITYGVCAVFNSISRDSVW